MSAQVTEAHREVARALIRRRDEQSYYCAYVDAAIAATEDKP